MFQGLYHNDQTLQMPGRKGITHPLIKKMTLMVGRVSRRSLETQGISKRDSDIMLQSWNKEYGNSMRRTSNGGLSIVIGNMSVVLITLFPKALDLLVEMYHQGNGYSAMNTARSSRTCLLTPVNGITFSAQSTVRRFLKGVFESRPTVSRYTDTGCRDSPASP